MKNRVLARVKTYAGTSPININHLPRLDMESGRILPRVCRPIMKMKETMNKISKRFLSISLGVSTFLDSIVITASAPKAYVPFALANLQGDPV